MTASPTLAVVPGFCSKYVCDSNGGVWSQHRSRNGEWRKLAASTQSKGGYNAQRTKMDLPVSSQVLNAVQAQSEEPIVKMPTLGGSLPLSIISDTLNVPTITVPIANYDNNQHAENENIRLQNLWDGIEIFAKLMAM